MMISLSNVQKVPYLSKVQDADNLLYPQMTKQIKNPRNVQKVPY